MPTPHTLDLIGHTPLIELQKLDTGCCQLFAKLESQNPGGSIKDRIAVSMIDDAEKRGVIQPGDTLIEATAGNTGLGLALVASQRGYPLILVIPDKMSRDKITHLRALGADVRLTRSDVLKGHAEYYQDKAAALAKELPRSWFVDQFNNPANPAAHEQTTAPEIWEQMEHKVDAIVVGVGSGGTLGGFTKFFGKHSPRTELVLADPVGSILAHYVQTGEVLTESGSWLVEGIGEDFIPSNADFSNVRTAYSISDSESVLTARKLLITNGIMAGSSSGTLLAAALRYCQQQTTPKRVLTLVCDSGNKYLSKMYNDLWMLEQGFLSRKTHGDLRDLIARLHEDGATVTLVPNDTLSSAYSRMRQYEVSQLPVLDGEKIVGLLDESDILFAVDKDPQAFHAPVQQFMSRDLQMLKPSDRMDKLMPLFRQGFVAIVADGDRFLGLITKVDCMQYLRRAL